MKNHFQYTILILAVIMLSSCHSKKEEQVSNDATENDADLITLTEEQFVNSRFQIGYLDTILVEEKIEAFGEVHVPEKNYREVTTYLGGIISDMNLIKGEYVKRGSRLFNITNPQLIKYQQDFLETKSKLEYLREETGRQKKLADENISARKNYTSVKADKEMAEATLASLSKQLGLLGIDTQKLNTSSLVSRLPIRAETSGYITEILVTNGGQLQEGQKAMKIMNTNHKHIELQVLEKDIALLDNGQKVNVFTPNNPTEKYEAEIYLIEKMLNQERMVTVHCHLISEKVDNLFPGMYIQATILTRTTEKVALPESAVVKLSNANYVLVQNSSDYQFKKVKVTTGLTQSGMTVIDNFESFSGTNTFLTKGAYYLVMEE